MSDKLDYGYLLSTEKLAADYKKYQQPEFKEQKKTFEKEANVNITRSIDEDGNPIIPPDVLVNIKAKDKDNGKDNGKDKAT